MMHGSYAIDEKGIVYFAKGYSVSVMPRGQRGPDCKGPTVGWTCKQFTYYNRNIGDNGEHATIYFAKSPHGDILVNWYARGECMFELAHTSAFFPKDLTQVLVFCKFNL